MLDYVQQVVHRGVNSSHGAWVLECPPIFEYDLFVRGTTLVQISYELLEYLPNTVILSIADCVSRPSIFSCWHA